MFETEDKKLLLTTDKETNLLRDFVLFYVSGEKMCKCLWDT